MTSTILITAPALSELIDSGTPVVVLDVRWRLDQPDGHPAYLAEHIPGAVYVSLDNELAKHGQPGDGRHPLPDVESLQDAARRWGINTGDTVVVYDDLKNQSAARAWWLLTNAGITDVRLLDGSLRAWTGAGLPTATGEVTPKPGSVTLAYGSLATIDIEQASTFAETGVLIDSRAAERYRGEVEPIDPRAGHIPGAVNAPTPLNVDADGKFFPAEELRGRFEALGVTDGAPVAVYCGSGVTAAHNAVALTLAGFSPVLYPGSWSQWSNHADRPVATGANPA